VSCLVRFNLIVMNSEQFKNNTHISNKVINQNKTFLPQLQKLYIRIAKLKHQKCITELFFFLKSKIKIFCLCVKFVKRTAYR